MKKIISIALTLCMVLGLCSFSVAAAPEGTAITDAAGFAAMDPAGTYYLANDITLTASYATAFAGTLDGNGKTITVSAPIFTEIAGATIKNLTVAGAIDGAAADCAAVAVKASGALVFENIVNNAAITNAKIAGAIFATVDSSNSTTVTGCINNAAIAGSGMTGGLIGKLNCNDADGNNASVVAITNCANYGDITSGNYGAGIVASIQKTLNATVANCANSGAIKGTHDSGGIIGHTTQAVMTVSYCENFGIVDTAGTGQYAGGICGYAWGTKTASWTVEKYSTIIEYCINHAEIIGDTRTGGICGSTGATDCVGIFLIDHCINLGNVTSKGGKTSFSQNCVAGILGYGYGTTATAYPLVSNCITVGNIHAGNAGAAGNAAYFLGYVNSPLAVIKDNTAIGTLTSDSGDITALGRNNGKDFAEVTGNAIPANTGYALTYENGVTDKVYEVATTDAAALTSGAAVYAFNQAAGKDVIYMAINGTDFAPTLVASEENVVVKNADGTYGNPVKEVETEPAPETTEPKESGATGDSFVVFAAIAAISVLGVAVVAKRREN